MYSRYGFAFFFCLQFLSQYHYQTSPSAHSTTLCGLTECLMYQQWILHITLTKVYVLYVKEVLQWAYDREVTNFTVDCIVC